MKYRIDLSKELLSKTAQHCQHCYKDQFPHKRIGYISTQFYAPLEVDVWPESSRSGNSKPTIEAYLNLAAAMFNIVYHQLGHNKGNPQPEANFHPEARVYSSKRFAVAGVWLLNKDTTAAVAAPP